MDKSTYDDIMRRRKIAEEIVRKYSPHHLPVEMPIHSSSSFRGDPDPGFALKSLKLEGKRGDWAFTGIPAMKELENYEKIIGRNYKAQKEYQTRLKKK